MITEKFMTLPEKETLIQPDPLYLVTMPIGIGDVSYGLSAIGQIVKNNQAAYGRTDILCTAKQMELFSCDPRVCNIHINEPIPNQRMIKKVLVPSESEKRILKMLRSYHYEAIFPGNASLLFDLKIGSPLMLPRLRFLLDDYFRLKHFEDVPAYIEVRKAVNNYFGNHLPDLSIDEPNDLFMSSAHLERASSRITQLIDRSGLMTQKPKVLMVATDTTTAFTRPPTDLLAAGIISAIGDNPNVLVCILPSYSSESSPNLMEQLRPYYSNTHLIDRDEGRPLQYIVGLIDQADVLITPDTYTMHLAVTRKIVADGDFFAKMPKNQTQVIVLYGATNPGLYGYPGRTIVLGRGRPEQRKIQPGLYKNSMRPNSAVNYFSHIKPEEIGHALSNVI